jgi:release factor glutamine methyltransferase
VTVDLAGTTIRAARRELTSRFKRAGLETPELDARLLVGAILGLDLTTLVTHDETPLSQADAERLASCAQRRIAREPVARILGDKEFWGLRFALSPDTLVPRPDTETVVEAALAFARSHRGGGEPLRIADIGTGTGAILLALLKELPAATGIGTDIATAALVVARANAERLCCSDRAEFFESDYLASVKGPFDLIVSNPPYIRTADIASLAPEVRDHEPLRALDGGADGLVAYRALCAESPARLEADGALIVEVGFDQAHAVADIMEANGLQVGRPFTCDLAGIPRVVEGRKACR